MERRPAPANNVFMDDHLIYALALITLTTAGNTLGLGHLWSTTPLVRRFPILK